MDQLHENIRRLREAAGITGRDAAASVGIHQADWSDLETGKNANPTLETLRKVANALNCTPVDLLVDTSIRLPGDRVIGLGRGEDGQMFLSHRVKSGPSTIQIVAADKETDVEEVFKRLWRFVER